MPTYYTFTYNYGNGDFFTGYGSGYSNYYGGQYIYPLNYPNETGNYGYYYLNTATPYFSMTYVNPYVSVDGYYDGDTGYGYAYDISTYNGYGELYAAYPYGYAYNSSYSNSDTYFDTYWEADLNVANTDVYYTYTYNYGNGDYFTGYGFADSLDNYYAGQYIYPGYNETGNYGYFRIDYVQDYGIDYDIPDEVYVTNYYDGDTGYGSAYDLTTYDPYYGLLNTAYPYGYAYNSSYSNSDSYFDTYWEADLNVANTDVYYTYTYNYGNGDYFTGYGFADSLDNYYAGQYIYPGYNETGNYGYFRIDYVQDYGIDYGIPDEVYVTNYYDGDTGYGDAYDLITYDPYDGLLNTAYLFGNAYNSSYSNSENHFCTYCEADLNVANTDVYYTYTYNYGNGDAFSGYGYADSLDNYYAGQYIYPGYNETGNYGYFYINYVQNYGVDYGIPDEVYVTNYYDGDTGYGDAYDLTTYDPYYGLLNSAYPYGYAYNSSYSNSNSYFDIYSEADLNIANTDVYYTYTHYYGNGDYFTGYGFADSLDNYYAGQFIDSRSNETGNYGYFQIDSVFDYGVDYGISDEVYVTNYYDGDTGYGFAYGISTDAPYYGLLDTAHPYGDAYNINYSNTDSFFSPYSEADLQPFSVG